MEILQKTTYFFCDKRYTSYREVLKDVKNPENIYYDDFFFDIFGDG